MKGAERSIQGVPQYFRVVGRVGCCDTRAEGYILTGCAIFSTRENSHET